MERIIINNAGKKFRIGFKKQQSALARLISVFSGREPKRDIWALNEVSFAVNAGEIIGIIGKNGSGKSTLLRAIAGVYAISNGEIETNGKIISLIDLNLGMQERLTLKDNVYLCCALFGIGRKEVRKRFSSIVSFAGLGDFANTKIYQFSTGMRQRLAFSVAIHCSPEILLLDEVFEVGDRDFRIRSAKKIIALAKKGGAVVLVSHDMAEIQKYCTKVLWLEGGKIVAYGNPKRIIKKYSRNGLKK